MGGGYKTPTISASYFAYGFISTAQTETTFFIPCNYIGSNITVSNLSTTIRLSSGGYAFARSGTDGSTYTQLGSSAVQLLSNGAYVRDNEITSISGEIRSGFGVMITVIFVNKLCSNNTGTLVTNNQVINVTGRITFTIS